MKPSEQKERKKYYSGNGMRRYEALMEACGGDAHAAASAAQLGAACRIAFAAKRPALINIAIDPFAGVESGNVHAFNAAKPNL